MTADAIQRLRRLMTVLPQLADAAEMPHAELERRTGVDAATMLDDLRALTERANEPGGFVESVGIVFEAERVSVRSSHFGRPMRLTIPELCTVELGLAMLSARTPPDERAPIDSARARVREAIVATAKCDAELWTGVPPSGPSTNVVSQIREAARRRTKIRLRYQSGSATDATDRVIHPYIVVPTHGTWFVVAHCERSDGMRFFRADRIERVELLAESFERPEVSAEELLPNGLPFSAESAGTLVVRYSPRIARWIAEREGVSPEADGSVTVEHPLADVQWAVRHVLQYGADAEVLAPEGVRREVARVLDGVVAGVPMPPVKRRRSSAAAE